MNTVNTVRAEVEYRTARLRTTPTTRTPGASTRRRLHPRVPFVRRPAGSGDTAR